jgi:hypothetical protein
MQYVYLLKLKQEHCGARSEWDYIFKSSAGVYIYLQELWDYWQSTVSEEDWERIGPYPTIGEMKAGMAASPTATHEILSLGFLNQGETLSIVLTVSYMPVY